MLQLKNIKKDYPAGDSTVHALKGIDVTFRKSEFVSILGPSGCGKTTMLNIIGGLDGYTDGDLIINGTSTKEYKDRDWDAYRNHSVGFVFQSYNLIPHQTVLRNVELALTLSGVSKQERKERARAALERVGLGDQINKRPSQLSGGQMQRVAIARALVNDPDIILADEPTGALDTKTSLQVMEILKEVSNDRLVVMVTHNPELAETYSTRIINMLDGLLVHDSMPYEPTDSEIIAELGGTLTVPTDEPVGEKKPKAKKKKKPSMSFFTAFSLSLKNLFTKKGRTALTAFAGSIGIIGIALILAVSQGMTAYIDHVQETTLSAYPLTLEAKTVDMSSLLISFMNSGSGEEHENDAVYKDPVITDLVNALSKVQENENDLAAFKAHLEKELKDENSELRQALTGIQYTYNLDFAVYTENIDGKIVKSDTGELMTNMLGDFMMQMTNSGSSGTDSAPTGSMSSAMMASMMGMNMWQELLPGLDGTDPINDILEEQYDVVYGSWPNDKDEIVLVLNEKNELDDLTLYALGLISEEDIDRIITAAVNKEEIDIGKSRWTYEEICARTFKTIFPYDKYDDFGTGVYTDISKNEAMLKTLYNKAFELKVVGIIKPNPDAETTMLSGSIGYTHLLTEHIIEGAKNSEVVKAQIANPSIDVLTGLPFESNTATFTDAEKQEAFNAYVSSLDTAEKAEAYIRIQCVNAEKAGLEAQVNGLLATLGDKNTLVAQISAMLSAELGVDAEMISGQLSELSLEELQSMIRPYIEEQVKAGIEAQVRAQLSVMTEDQLAAMLDMELAGYTTETAALYYDEVTKFSPNTKEQTNDAIGYIDLDTPFTINLYASTFENKDVIVAMIDEYNAAADENQKIAYTDFLGIMMSSITTIINAITYVLIAFVAISLVVSSIMIGVITLISVQERTKEIGILRAIGASKRDVSSMFNAETVIIGFASGLLGVLVTYLLCIPINLILHALTGIPSLNAILPVSAAAILVGISVLLTLIAGIIPSRSAAKKDPVVALRTE